MTPEKQMKNRLQDMPLKQKITIVITIIVVLIVIWQVIGLFGNESVPPAKAPVIATKMNSKAPAASNMIQGPGNLPPGQPMVATQAQAVPPGQVVAPREVAITRDQYLQEQEKTEKKYLKQLNDLEQLKLERQIEETNQAIATARLATVTAEKSTADLLTKPTPVVSNAAYANQLVRPTRSGESVVESSGPPEIVSQPPTSVAELEPPPIPDVSYSVISVSMQFNRWTAVIGSQGKLFNVSVGDTLPPDGSVIVSINKNGVVLKKDDRKRKVSITSAI
jgi:hypothetical protein